METYFKNGLNQVEYYRKSFVKAGFISPSVGEIIRGAQLSEWDSYHLFNYAKRIPEGGTYLEIGTAQGGSVLCAYLATQVAKISVNLITIDSGHHAFCNEAKFNERTKSIPNIKLLLFPSDIAVNKIQDNSVDLCFIDGGHLYEQVKRDFLNYWPKIKTGGILLGHDYIRRYPGIIKATWEVFGKKLTLLDNSVIFKVEKTGVMLNGNSNSTRTNRKGL